MKFMNRSLSDEEKIKVKRDTDKNSYFNFVQNLEMLGTVLPQTTFLTLSFLLICHQYYFLQLK